MRHDAIVGWPNKTFPTGWFQVAWSGELERGQVASRHYWATDLVVWRGESGAIYVMEARESRRGTHLGMLGQVRGEAIECVVDGWQWQPDGTASTPDGQPIEGAAALRSFVVREVMGLVLVWYDHAGLPPTYEVDVEPWAESGDFYPAWPHGSVCDPMACQPQVMAENIADVVHIKYAHRWLDIPSVTAWEDDSPVLRVAYQGRFSSPKGPVEAVFNNKAYGFGVLRTQMASLRRFLHFLCPTPIDHATMDVRLSAWVERAAGDTGDEPDSVAKAIIKAQHYEVLGTEVDRNIWENQAYIQHPGFRSQERHYISFRKWAEQFYPHEAASAQQSQPAGV